MHFSPAPSAPSNIFTTTATAGAAWSCLKPSPQWFRESLSARCRGVRHGPPEEVVGPWGYGEFLEAHRGRKARTSCRTTRMVRRRLRSEAVRCRRNQSPSCRARPPAARPRSGPPVEFAGGPPGHLPFACPIQEAKRRSLRRSESAPLRRRTGAIGDSINRREALELRWSAGVTAAFIAKRQW